MSSHPFDHTNRLWSMPLLFGSGTVAAFYARHAQGGAMDCAVQAGVAAGVGFLFAIGISSMTGTGEKKAPNPKSRRGQQELLEQQRREISDLKHEMTKLEDSMSSYLKQRTAEGHKLHATMMDMNQDIRRLRETDHTAELRPQLDAINEKFGELQGVRQIVAALTVKMRLVDTLAAQINDAEARFAGQVKQGSVQMLERLRGEVAVLREDLAGALTNQLTGIVDEKVTQKVGEQAEATASNAPPAVNADEMLAQLQANLETLVETRLKVVAAAAVASGEAIPAIGGLRVLPGGAGMTSGEFAAVATADGGADADKMLTLERRIQKMSGTIESLRTTIQDLKFAGPVEDKGIPSIYRKPAGLDMSKPGATKKSGALAKMFQDNLKLKQQVSAA